LVENNLCHSNGGKGIHIYLTDNVTVRNNTCWRNNLDPNNPGTWRSELSNVNARNNRWYNNIGMADPQANSNNTALGNQSYGGVTNNGTSWNHNLTFNGTNGQASLHITSGNTTPRGSDGNLLGVNPHFANAAASDFDFSLKSNSPAVDADTAEFGLPSRDLANHPRVAGLVDIGAYEYGASSEEPPVEEPQEPPATEPPGTEPPVAEPPVTEPPDQGEVEAPQFNFTFADRVRRFEILFGRNPTLGGVPQTGSTTPPVAQFSFRDVLIRWFDGPQP
jgi:parallel beta-helix repeat protein